MSGPGALCRGPALFVSGPGGPLPALFLSGPGALCRGPALFVSGPGTLCRDPAVCVDVCVGDFCEAFYVGARRSVSGPDALRRGLCIGARRFVSGPDFVSGPGALSGPGTLCVGARRSIYRAPALSVWWGMADI